MMCRAAVIYLNKAIEQLEKNEHTNATELIMGAYREIIHEEGHREAQEGRDSAKLKWVLIPDEAPAEGPYMVECPEGHSVAKVTVCWGDTLVMLPGTDAVLTWDEFRATKATRIAGPIEPPGGG